MKTKSSAYDTGRPQASMCVEKYHGSFKPKENYFAKGKKKWAKDPNVSPSQVAIGIIRPHSPTNEEVDTVGREAGRVTPRCPPLRAVSGKKSR